VIQKFKNTVAGLLRQVATKANYRFVLKNFQPLLELQHVHALMESKRFFQLIDTVELNAPKGRKIVVIAPHTDDDIFGPGGTLLKAADKGALIDVIYLSNSAKTPVQTAKVKEEAKTVCHRYGAMPHFLDMEPGKFPHEHQKMANLLKTLTPDTLFITFFLDDNDDHRRANQLLLGTTESLGFFATEVWAYQVYSTIPGNVVIDITDTMSRKNALMKLWQNVEGERDWPHYVQGLNMVNCRYLKKKGSRYGELFFVLPITDYLALCREYFSIDPSNLYRNTRYHEHLHHK
jgi:LmbE family N-acetylglucosaminyl deacetylase